MPAHRAVSPPFPVARRAAHHRTLALLESAVADRSGAAPRALSPPSGARLNLALASSLGAATRRFQGQSIFDLAVTWATESERLPGRELLALLWVVARRHEEAARPLEEEIACEVERRALRMLAEA